MEMSSSIETSTTDIIDYVTDDVSSAKNTDGEVSLLAMRVAVLIVGVVGALDNGIVLWVLYRVSAVRKQLGNLYLINQCVVDLLCSVSVVVTYATFLGVKNIGGYWGFVLCKVILSECSLWALYALSTFNLVLMNVDRYITISHPTKRHFWCNKKLKWACVFACWGLAFGIYVPVQILTTGVVNNECYQNIIWPSSDVALIWGYAVFVSSCLLPLLIFVLVYVRIYMVVRKSKIAVASSTSHANSISIITTAGEASGFKKVSKEEKQVLKTLVLVSLVFAICVTPSNIYYLLFNLGYDLNFSNSLYYFLLALAMANCATNPFVYMAKLKTLRNAIKLMLGFGP